MSKLPLKISPCPIIGAIAELKFHSTTPKGAIFGILYNAVKEDFHDVKKLQTATLSNEVIENDPSLKYKALYKLSSGKFTAQIGMDVVSLHCSNEYVGWKDFSDNIFSFLKKVNETGIIEQPISFSLRYLNFFELDIFEKINLKVALLNKPYKSSNLVIRTETPQDDFINVLQVANNVTVSNHLNGQKTGSLIDIACVMNNPINLFSNISEIINQAHKLEKEFFFGLLKTEFINSLNPEYKK